MDLRPIGWPARAWLIANGLFYLQGVILLVAAIHPPSHQGAPGVFSTVMAHLVGRLAVLVVGLAMFGTGIVLTYRAVWRPGIRYRARYRSIAPTALQPAIRLLGRVGTIGRGISVTVVGILLVLDVWTRSARKADAADEALRNFWKQPYGRPLLVIFGLAVIAFGIYELAEARYRRILTADSSPVHKFLGGGAMLRTHPFMTHDKARTTIVRQAVPLVIAMILVGGVLAAVGGLLAGARTGTGVTAWDAHVSRWFLAHRTPSWNQLSQWGSYLAETITVVAVTAVTIVVLRWWLGRWRESIVVVVAIVGELVIFLSVTALIHRHRPSVPRLDPSVLTSTSSFPSGHTGAAVALYGALGVIILRNVHRRWLAGTLATVLFTIPLIVGVSRIYRGMHFPTDAMTAAVAMGGWLTVVLAVLLPRSRSSADGPPPTPAGSHDSRAVATPDEARVAVR
jgi:undecaprenyl-diphosphatase